MASDKTIQVSFAGGEIAPDMYGRKDDLKYQNGLALCQNFICLPQGPIRNRPGFEYVNEAGDGAHPVRLLPFTYSAGQTMIIELGHKYARFHSYGATLVNDDGSAYQVTAPWDAADLFDLRYVQSGDIVTVVHPNYPPYEIRRYGARDWRIVKVVFNTTLSAPTNVSAVRATAAAEDPNADKYTQKYKVSCLNADKTEESEPSGAVSCTANLFSYGTTVRITCSRVSGAFYYRFYKNKGGLYGYIGDSEDPEIIDDNITPKTDITPRRIDDVFQTARGIQSVTVTNGGSGYVVANGALQDTPCDVVAYQENTKTVDPPSLTCELYDEAGSGEGGQIALETTTSKGSYLDNVSELNIWTAKTHATKIKVIKPGKNYVSPKVRFTTNASRGTVDSNDYLYGKHQLYLWRNNKTGTLSMNKYNSMPTVEVSDSTGTGAKLQPVVDNGKITSIVIQQAGKGYTNPIIKISGGGGSGATATATVGTTGVYPRAVGYFEQRRIFAGLSTDPQRVLMTRTGSESDFSYSLPFRDDDRISFQMAARDFSAVEHVVSLTSLILLTTSMAYRAASQDSGAITPSSIAIKPQSNSGASRVTPQVVGNSVVYNAARGGHLMSFAYEYSAGGFVSADLCLRASHLFDFKTINDSALMLAPIPVLWYTNSDGALLGLTYIPEQEVAAWHKHKTDGFFESVACVEEGSEDHLYAVVRRNINGEDKRFIERMTSMNVEKLEDAFFVDCGGVYDGQPATTIAGLSWLEGKTVSILADGAVMPQQVVTGGKVTLPTPASKVIVGLPYTADAKTLPLVIQQSYSLGSGLMKNITKAFLRVCKSSGVFVGTAFDDLVEYKQRSTEPMGEPPRLMTEEIEIRLPAQWQSEGVVCIRQGDPLPLTLQALTLTVSA